MQPQLSHNNCDIRTKQTIKEANSRVSQQCRSRNTLWSLASSCRRRGACHLATSICHKLELDEGGLRFQRTAQARTNLVAMSSRRSRARCEEGSSRCLGVVRSSQPGRSTGASLWSSIKSVPSLPAGTQPRERCVTHTR